MSSSVEVRSVTINPIQKIYNKAEKRHDYWSGIVNALNDTFDPATTFVRFPKAFHTASAIGGVFGSLDLLFAPRRLSQSLSSIFTESTMIKKVRASCESVREVAIIGLDVLGIVSSLQSLGMLSSRVLSWAMPAAPYLGLVKVITMPFALHDTYSVNKLRNELQSHFKRPEKLSSEDERIKNVVRGLDFVQQKGQELTDQLALSKKCDVVGRAELLSKVIDNKQGLEKAESFMSVLRTRVRTVTGLEVAARVADVAGLGLSIAGIAVSPAAPPVVPALLIVAGVADLTLTGLKTLMLDKQPFDVKPDTWYKKVKVSLQTGIQTSSYYAYKAVKTVTVKPVRHIVALSSKAISV